MLKANRNEVLHRVLHKLKYEMNHPATMDGSFYLETNGQVYHMNGYSGEIAVPHCAQGWPPELQEYIKRVAMTTAIAIVESIYTEEELDARVDGILLSDRHEPS